MGKAVWLRSALDQESGKAGYFEMQATVDLIVINYSLHVNEKDRDCLDVWRRFLQVKSRGESQQIKGPV